jgi:hypothetical protein
MIPIPNPRNPEIGVLNPPVSWSKSRSGPESTDRLKTNKKHQIPTENKKMQANPTSHPRIMPVQPSTTCRWLRRLATSPCAALALLLLGPSPAQATSQPMFAGYNTGDGPGGYSLGTRFTTGTDFVSVSKLGFFDRDQDGLASSHQVALYDSSNSQVAYAVIPAGTAGELIGDFRYVALGSALLLSPNTTYTLMAAVNGDSVPHSSALTSGFSSPNFDGFAAVAAWAANNGGTTVKAPEFKWDADGNVCTSGNLIGAPVATLHTITASVTGSGGTITPSGDVLVADGGSQTFTIAPDFGHVIADVLVDGGSVGTVMTYPFNNVTGAHTIAASFSALPSVMVSGTVSVGGVATDAATVNLYTDPACVNLATSTDTASGGTYSISVPQSSTFYLKATKSGFVPSAPLEVVTGTANLSGQNLNITSRRFEAEDAANTRVNVGNSSDAGASGGVRVAKQNQSAYAGVTFNSVNVAETGFYTLTLRYYGFGDNRNTQISVNGAPVSGSPFVCNAGGYATLAPVPVLLLAGDNSVAIGAAAGDWGPHWDYIDVSTDFTPATLHTITASVTGSGGSITPSGDVTVVDSGSQTFTITPDFGYGIADVLVDGGSVGAVTTYPFTTVTGAHTIAASFSALPTVNVSGTVSVGGVATDVATVDVYTDSAGMNLVASADTVPSGTYTVSAPQSSTLYLKASKSGFAPSALLEVVTGTGNLAGQDFDLIIRRYEAENAALVNCGIPGDFNDLASGGKRVSGSENAASLTFSVYAETAGDYPIVMGYFQPWDGNRNTAVTVNGTAIPNIPAPGVPAPNYGKSTATLPLVAGVNSVVLSNIGTGWGPHWDYIDVPQPIYIATATAGIGGSISPSGGTFIVGGFKMLGNKS